MKKIIILGGYGDGEVVASALEDLQASGAKVVPMGFLNDFELIDSLIAGLPVLGKIPEAPNFLKEPDILFIAAILKVKESQQRARKIEGLGLPPDRYFTLIHPQASVARSSTIGYGTFVGPHVTINPNAVIGNHCSLRASANIGHDCIINNHCYIGPNSTLSGRVKLGEGVHIGPNASILERVDLGDYSVVGIGSAVVKDVPPLTVVFGCPARIVSKIEFTS